MSAATLLLAGLASAFATPLMAAAPSAAAASLAEPHDVLWVELEGYRAPDATTPAPAHNDLLERLRRGFRLPVVRNRPVQAQLDWFVRHPQYLDRVLRRAQRYLPYITDELARRGLPLELALLPVVESAYDPFAYSHGRASGLWQIVPGTGTRFGIRQNWWYDGRRDIVDSTNGALSYLEYLHNLMDGDWLNAIASYNSGEGNVARSKRRNRAAGRNTDFWNLKLPRETESYVPKLLALAAIVRDPDEFGLQLPDLLDEPQFAIADTGGQLDLALAAELAGLTLNDLYAWNPGFNRWATDPDGPHRMLMPVEAIDQFTAALDGLPVSERVRWKRHRVRSGEALSQIAQRYHTTLEAIREANGINGNLIRAGDHLMIPVASKPLSDYSLSANQRRVAKQSQARDGQRLDHVVSAGESFWSISRRYGVGVRELASWNAMAPRDTLRIGQKLVVWSKQSAPARLGNATTRKLNYTVRRGDSLHRIANRFRVTLADLLRWNNLDKNRILRPGQKLTMYVDVTAQSS